MRRKTMRFDSIKQVVEYIESTWPDEELLRSKLRGEKIKRMNYAITIGNGDDKKYLMANGKFEYFNAKKFWGGVEETEKEFESGVGSTLYKVGADGELTPKLWWRKKGGDNKREEIIRIIESVSEADIPLINTDRKDDQCVRNVVEEKACTLYNIADAHIGMLSWEKESGVNYDSNIAKAVIRKGFSSLFANSREVSKKAIVSFLGDYMHTDGYKPLTPNGQHLLDADSRFGKAFYTAYTTAISVVMAVASVHEEVEVFVIPGNHDESSSLAMMVAMQSAFSHANNIIVHDQYSRSAYTSFGNTIIGFHHGNIKKANLPLMMTEDVPRMLGNSKFRMWFCGHSHHGGVQNIGTFRIETVESIAPADAFLRGVGPGKKNTSMQAIVFDEEMGEKFRINVNLDINEIGKSLEELAASGQKQKGGI